MQVLLLLPEQASGIRLCVTTWTISTRSPSGARFRDTSQQIHKQWQADPARAFPTVGSVATTVGGGSPSPASGDISTPNSTPSPSPSPTNGQQVMRESKRILKFSGEGKIPMKPARVYVHVGQDDDDDDDDEEDDDKPRTLHEVGAAGTAGAAGGTAGGIAGRFCFIINGDDEDVVESQF
uniref:Uncharacterized protein n=1 Tax=Vespula pensylvanica TaxID=30213 RepID=A0A834PGW6_VESPE|nr:hypothetical protein H0235_001839 [Vespula pensylvanica]